MRTNSWIVLTALTGLGTGCMIDATEGGGSALGMNWDCATGSAAEQAACKAAEDAPTKRFLGQTDFKSAAHWSTIFRQPMLQSARDAQQAIEESDIYKVEGDTLYALNQYRGLYVIDISHPDSPRVMAREPLYGYPRDMYVRGGNAYILFNNYYTWTLDEDSDDDDDASEGAQVVVVNVEQGGSASHRTARTHVAGQYKMDGWMVDSRLVYETEGAHRAFLYVISSDTEGGYWWDYEEDEDVVSGTAPVNKTHIMALNVTNPAHIERQGDILTFDGYTDVVQATVDNIFVAQYDWYSWDSSDERNKSTVKIIGIGNDGRMTLDGEIQAHGYVQHKFNLGYDNGILTVVTHDWSWEPETGGSGDVYVASYDLRDHNVRKSELKLTGVGALEATRFDGKRLYVVHVEMVDPIEIIDLSDPANLHSLGQLEIPGWIEHLEVRGNTLLGAGYDTGKQGNTPATIPQTMCPGYTLDGQVIDQSQPYPSLPDDTRKLSVSAYDVTDPATFCEASRSRFGVGDWSWANFSEDKAMRMFNTNAPADPDHVRPGEDKLDDLWLIPWEGYNDTTSQSINAVQIVDVNLPRDSAQQQQGQVTADAGTPSIRARGMINALGSVDRAFPSHNRIMTLGTRSLEVADISNKDAPVNRGHLEMSRNVQTFTLAGGYGVQLINDWDTEVGELRVVSLDNADAENGDVISRIQLKLADTPGPNGTTLPGKTISADEIYTNGADMTLVGRDWDWREIDGNNDGDMDDDVDHYEDIFMAHFANYRVNAQGRISFRGFKSVEMQYDGGFGDQINLHDIIRVAQDIYVVSSPAGKFNVVNASYAEPRVTHTQQAPAGDYHLVDLEVFYNDVYAISYRDAGEIVQPQPPEDREITEVTTENGANGATKAAKATKAKVWHQRATLVRYSVTRVKLNAQGAPTEIGQPINVPGRLIGVDRRQGHGRETWTLLDNRWVIEPDGDLSQSRAILTVQAALGGGNGWVASMTSSLVGGAEVPNSTNDVIVMPPSDTGDAQRAAYFVKSGGWSGPVTLEDGTPNPDRRPHLYVVDLSDPTNVTQSADLMLPGQSASLRRVANVGPTRYGFISLGWGGGLAVIDVTNAAAPNVREFIRSNGGARTIEVSPARHAAYFAAGEYGVQTVRLGTAAGGGAAAQ